MSCKSQLHNKALAPRALLCLKLNFYSNDVVHPPPPLHTHTPHAEYTSELMQLLQSSECSSMSFKPFPTKEHLLLYLLVHGTKPIVSFCCT